MEIVTAKKCAWRAFYLKHKGRVLFALGIDPTFGGNRPRVFCVLNGRYRHINLWRARYWYKLDGRH